MHARFQSLISEDDFEHSAWRAEPNGAVKGGVVVLQEIFGLTGHITQICERLAEAGYLAIAPDLFARTGVSRPISYDDAEAGLAAVEKTDQALLDLDIAAAFNALEGQPAAVIGFCWGGGQGWRAACRNPVQAAALFYPTRMADHLDGAPQGQVQVHLAHNDRHTPDEVTRAMLAVKPELSLYRYEAAHGFMCSQRTQHNALAANAAWARMLSLFDAAL